MGSLRRRALHAALYTALVGVALSGASLPALAQGLADDSSEAAAVGGPPPWAYQMAHDLMSPFCPGRTLAACPSPQADQLRQWILFQASAGQSQSEIEASLYDRFGDVLLSAPKAEGGWGISAYAIPIGGFLLGGPLVAFAIYRLARGGPSRGPAPTASGSSASSPPGTARASEISDEDLERLVRDEFARS